VNLFVGPTGMLRANSSGEYRASRAKGTGGKSDSLRRGLPAQNGGDSGIQNLNLSEVQSPAGRFACH
jgi:hypothetical protein